MISRARVFALHAVLSFASWSGNVRLYAWAFRALHSFDESDKAGA